MSLSSKINKIIKEHINLYITEISNECNIDKRTLQNIWKTIGKEKLKHNSEYSNCQTCQYIFKRGYKSGSKCNKHIKSGEFCSQHKKKNKIKTCTKRTNPKHIIIQRNKKIDRFWHKETSLVFKSKDDRIVIGILKDDNVQKLSHDDIDTCKKWGFNFQK